MLKKIVIDNVGVLKAFSTPGSPRLERLTTIHARNGRGKSTLTAILRAAGDGTAEPVVGRHSFGSDRPPEIVLARDSGTVRFADERWTSRLPVEVFDTHFIAENVHAGEMPDLDHDRGLFWVIVGRDGVRLGRRLEFFTAAAKRTGARLKAAEQALALDRDDDLAGRIIVFDDPLSSHDSHRRTRTVEALRDLGARCRQVLVLSHDEWFIRELCRACHAMSPVTYQIEFEGREQWSVARSVDPDDLCRSDHAISVDMLKAFHERREGDPATAVLHVRRVLETHFRRAYSGWFGPVDDLGVIVEAIRREGPTHPCAPLLARLDACNAATRERHHGEDARLGSRAGVDPDELDGIVRDALVVIGAVKR